MPFPPPVHRPDIDRTTTGPDEVNVETPDAGRDGRVPLCDVPLGEDISLSQSLEPGQNLGPLRAEPLLLPCPALDTESESGASFERESEEFTLSVEPIESTATVPSEDPIIERGPGASSTFVEPIEPAAVLPVEASVEREPAESPMLAERNDPAAALRGRRWLEPHRVSPRCDTPDSLGATTRRANPHARAQSAIAIALTSAAVIAGVALGIRVGMSRHENATTIPSSRPSSLSLSAPSGSSLPMVPSATSALPLPPTVAPSSVAPTEPPSSATATTTGDDPEPPVPKSPPRAKITRHASGGVQRAPSTQPNAASGSGVPVDQIYVNKNGDLVDARGKPLHGGSTQPDSPRNAEQTGPAPHDDESEQRRSAPREDSGQQHPAPSKDDTAPKSVDEAQPWH